MEDQCETDEGDGALLGAGSCEAARAHEQLVGQDFQKLDAPRGIGIEAIAATHVCEVANPVWYGLDAAVHGISLRGCILQANIV